MPLKAFKTSTVNFDGALGREEFRQFVLYERMRADRTHSRFTLVIIKLELEKTGRSTYRSFLAALYRQLRSTDQVGWYGESKLGILLPDTTISGAGAFIKSIYESTGSIGIVKSIVASMYPRVANLRLVIDELDDEATYYSTYEKKLEGTFLRTQPAWKRIIDVTFGVLGGLLCFPALVFATLFVVIVSPGSPIGIEDRVGFGGHIFPVFTLRTRKPGADSDVLSAERKEYMRVGDRKPSPEQSGQADIPGARLIRLLRLDDLPQLLNVLRGDMCLVGPRPCHPSEAELYLHWHKRRFDIPPGLTGTWYLAGPDRSTFGDLMRADIRYGENPTPWIDIAVILATPPALIASIWRAVFRRRKAQEPS